MGYYHSWRGPGAPEAFRLIRAHFEKLILPLADVGCPIAGPLGTGVPEITDDYIQFNGIRYCGHEKVDGPVVIFPAEDACGIDSDHGKLFAVAFLGLVTKRRCDGQCCHDDFLLGKRYDRGFCKTAFKPYDVAVTAALLIAKHHWGERFEITSCGSDAQWWDAKLICQRVLGYGALFRFVPKRRLSTINGQFDEVEEQLFGEVPGSEAVDPDHPPSYEEGLRKGMLRTVRRIIEHRFGPLTPDHEHRLWRLSRSDIEDLAVRLLEAKTLDEVFL